MPKRSHPGQFDLFPAPQREGPEQPTPPDDAEEFMSVPEDAPYVPTDAEAQEHAETEHGSGARHVPAKSRAARDAERRRMKQLIDDARGRLGESGRQLLTDAESPFMRGVRDAAEIRRRAREEEERRRQSGKT